MLNIGRWLSIGKHAFSTCRPRRTNFSIRINVGETYKHSKFGQDRFTGGVATQWWNVTVLWLLFSLVSFRFLISPTGPSRPIRTFNCSNDVFGFVQCHFGVWSLQIHFWGVSGPKNINISTCFWTTPNCSGNRFGIRALENKLSSNVKKTSQKLDFWLEVTNQEFISHTGGSTGSVFFKMAAAAILNFENMWPFPSYWFNPYQI